ncbi:ceramide synthase 2-like [Genypterus blacodes]|uniref:ceramide synthase 2-like n=1 Tax=Genypterus blacodes TaxID=154954 RepID=UPI003F7601AC
MELLPDVWKQEYWLPPGITWEDMERLSDRDRPLPQDLLMALPLALGFVGLRYVFERFCAPPMARCLGVRKRLKMVAASSPKLESFYTKQSRRPSQSEMLDLMSQCGKTQRQIETWFRLRRNQDRPCRTKKFSEAAWRFFFYLTAFLGGLACVTDRSWFWDHKECWRHYPLQPLERVHYWYYMLELGFYLSLLLRISVDIKRKDFKEQVIHHLATMFLLSFSYCANYIRVGTLVMLLHDSSDILLESAKMFNYGSGWRKTCDTLFVVFAVVFFMTRLVVFPSRIIHTTLVLSMEIFQPFFGYYFFNILLMVLQVLHIFWAGLILRMIYKFLNGKMHKDERSDEESEVEGEEEKNAQVEDEAETGDYCWERRKDTLNSKLSMLNNSFVLNKLTNHRTSAINRMRKAQ